MTCFGLDIGGTKSSAVLGELDWERGTYYRVDRVEIPMEGDSWQSVLDRLVAACRNMTFFHQELKSRAVGISCGGPLDGRKGIIYSPPNLPGWDDVPIVDYVSTALDIPAFLENDANACALAEWRFGEGIGCNNLIFLTFGTGLGAGLVLDGHLYSGTNGLAGEVGHIRLEDDGPLGYGKHGSFEGFCSGAASPGLPVSCSRNPMPHQRLTPIPCLPQKRWRRKPFVEIPWRGPPIGFPRGNWGRVFPC